MQLQQESCRLLRRRSLQDLCKNGKSGGGFDVKLPGLKKRRPLLDEVRKSATLSVLQVDPTPTSAKVESSQRAVRVALSASVLTIQVRTPSPPWFATSSASESPLFALPLDLLRSSAEFTHSPLDKLHVLRAFDLERTLNAEGLKAEVLAAVQP